MVLDIGRRMLMGAAAVVVADQAAKSVASELAARPGWLMPIRNPGVGLTLVTVDRWGEAALMAAALAVAAYLLVRAVVGGNVPGWASALVLGGSAGNLIDRTFLGSVRDFLPVGHLFVVNLADIAIVLGMTAIAIAVWVTRPSAAAQ